MKVSEDDATAIKTEILESLDKYVGFTVTPEVIEAIKKDIRDILTAHLEGRVE